ncbi:hypothetical protein D3Z48_14105 [Clostridiaceae bacterium]|nr:hypothetical protein [Clostridiaceae bacterium]
MAWRIVYLRKKEPCTDRNVRARFFAAANPRRFGRDGTAWKVSARGERPCAKIKHEERKAPQTP